MVGEQGVVTRPRILNSVQLAVRQRVGLVRMATHAIKIAVRLVHQAPERTHPLPVGHLPSTMYSSLAFRKMTPSPTSWAFSLSICTDVSPFAPALAMLKLFRSTVMASLLPS
jgi:hypothetical protein